MKRSDVLADTAWIIADNEKQPDTAALRVLSYLEDIGMLPPPRECKLVPDERRPGTMKQGTIERSWDDE